ncbi:uncharacterized protein L969DRAFT_93218 [Mixia osmundae IAM 14324]|uniref:ARID domain-containing protein n=1 Tax=Mixia osmundae (strain CBS 9802 / IAM 14324 / JCM 22182 / KY 12970) TaxID=764103 RepID=G7E5R4_MIXOS|nr:uncharacterized protein L969DRAFT_93218 [Mixia osmundae IAM 14324]KEI40676.1 hypothetical protein L969DRAFT_93218 [Mixia osmundae IAM 14324]GAA98174.1 hypothetical protein E5Q_04857 [Mixia osmundae IAM 14324]
MDSQPHGAHQGQYPHAVSHDLSRSTRTAQGQSEHEHNRQAIPQSPTRQSARIRQAQASSHAGTAAHAPQGSNPGKLETDDHQLSPHLVDLSLESGPDTLRQSKASAPYRDPQNRFTALSQPHSLTSSHASLSPEAELQHFSALAEEQHRMHYGTPSHFSQASGLVASQPIMSTSSLQSGDGAPLHSRFGQHRMEHIAEHAQEHHSQATSRYPTSMPMPIYTRHDSTSTMDSGPSSLSSVMPSHSSSALTSWSSNVATGTPTQPLHSPFSQASQQSRGMASTPLDSFMRGPAGPNGDIYHRTRPCRDDILQSPHAAIDTQLQPHERNHIYASPHQHQRAMTESRGSTPQAHLRTHERRKPSQFPKRPVERPSHETELGSAPAPALQRRLPPRPIRSEEDLTHAYIEFCLYCNPHIPIDPVPAGVYDLRRSFNAVPKSGARHFKTWDLLGLLERLEGGELRTWTHLCTELGVERTSEQSPQRIGQYSVRLKRWIRQHHIDAFSDYLTGKPNAYYEDVRYPGQNGYETGYASPVTPHSAMSSPTASTFPRYSPSASSVSLSHALSGSGGHHSKGYRIKPVVKTDDTDIVLKYLEGKFGAKNRHAAHDKTLSYDSAMSTPAPQDGWPDSQGTIKRRREGSLELGHSHSNSMTDIMTDSLTSSGPVTSEGSQSFTFSSAHGLGFPAQLSPDTTFSVSRSSMGGMPSSTEPYANAFAQPAHGRFAQDQPSYITSPLAYDFAEGHLPEEDALIRAKMLTAGMSKTDVARCLQQLSQHGFLASQIGCPSSYAPACQVEGDVRVVRIVSAATDMMASDNQQSQHDTVPAQQPWTVQYVVRRGGFRVSVDYTMQMRDVHETARPHEQVHRLASALRSIQEVLNTTGLAATAS